MNSPEKNSEHPHSEFQDNLNLLRQTYFFSGLPLETLKVFAYLCTRQRFDTGERLFSQEEEDGQAFYFIEGQAKLEREDNGNARKIRSYKTGDFVGGLTLLSKLRRLYSLTATEPTICLVLTREKFSKALQQFPEIMPRVFKAVANGIDRWEDRFLNDVADQCGGCLEKLGVSLI
jgi:CRP-like cAMP-binding protein